MSVDVAGYRSAQDYSAYDAEDHDVWREGVANRLEQLAVSASQLRDAMHAYARRLRGRAPAAA